MKTKKLLRTIRAQLSAFRSGERSRSKAIKKAVKAIRERETRLGKKLLKTSGKKEQKAIRKEIAVLHAQRKKAKRILHEMRQASA